MGPLGMIFKTLAKVGGKTVQKDINLTEKFLERQHFAKYKNEFSSYHEKKISDLATDDGVSASWLKELIQDSKSVDQLNTVWRYMSSKLKTANLSPGTKREIMAQMSQKMEAVRDKEMLMKMAAFIRDHGGDLL